MNVWAEEQRTNANLFQIENLLKFRELDFRKFFPIEKFLLEKFQNYRREVPNGSHSIGNFMLKNFKMGHFLKNVVCGLSQYLDLVMSFFSRFF